VVLLAFIVLFLLSSSADATRRRTESKLQRLAEAEQLAAGYAEAERARKQAEAALTSSEVSLPTYVDEKGRKAGLDIPSLNPKGDVPVGDGRIIESSVELTLDRRLAAQAGGLPRARWSRVRAWCGHLPAHRAPAQGRCPHRLDHRDPRTG
jgi:hypothetical protein